MTEHNANEELNAFNAKHERQKACERLQDAIKTLDRAKEDLERCLENFNDAETDRERARQVNYAINYLVSNIQPNLRIDLLAHSQAELIRTGL